MPQNISPIYSVPGLISSKSKEEAEWCIKRYLDHIEKTKHLVEHLQAKLSNLEKTKM